MRQSSQKNRKAFWLLFALIQLSTIPLQVYFSWLMCIPVGLVLGFAFRNKIGSPFVAGFIAFSLQWIAYAAYRDAQNDSLLAARISTLFGLPDNPIYSIVLTGILGGIFMGSMVLSGFLFGKLIAPKADKGYY